MTRNEFNMLYRVIAKELFLDETYVKRIALCEPYGGYSRATNEDREIVCDALVKHLMDVE